MKMSEKLFDSTIDYDKTKAISGGTVEDTSSIAGPTNVELTGGPLIGRKQEMRTIF